MGYKWKKEAERGHDIQSTVSYQHNMLLMAIMMAAICCIGNRGTLCYFLQDVASTGYGPGSGSWAAAAGRLQ